MKLTLVRKTLTGKSTIGELSVDGIHQCFTLEDTVREKKVFGETAILPIHAAGGSAAFVRRGGRIPAPLSSLRN